MIEFFIDVARECFNIGNFNSLMAIICESQSVIWELEIIQSGLITVFGICSIRPLCCSWYEHESCVSPEEDLGQSEDCQVFHFRGKMVTLTRSIKNCQSREDDWRCVYVLMSLRNSIRWILRGTFTTTGQPWGGQHTALGLPTATERRWGAASWRSPQFSSAIQTFYTCFFVSLDCNPLLQSADQRHLLPERRMCKPAAQWPRQLWG